MPSQDFHKFLQQYVPKLDKVDTTGSKDDVQKIYEIQCALAKYLKNQTNPNQNLQILLQYCRGDVLSSALPSLYSSFCRIPENKLYPALEELNSKAVSTRKHSIFLTTIIGPIQKIIMKFNQVKLSEKHVSVRQHMFLSCYKYYLRNNIEECWPLLEDYIKQLKKEQKDILKLITDVHKVSIDNRAIFTECVWNILCQVKKEDNKKIDDNMESLLSKLNASDIKLFHDDFVMNIIEKYLFNLNDCSMNDTVFNLTNSFLVSCGNTEKKVTFIFNCIHHLKEKFWENKEKKMDALKIISEFCFSIFKKLLMNSNELEFDKNFPKLFVEAWKKEFTIEETFEEHIFLDFMVMHTASNSDSEALTKDISEYFSSTLERYGNLIIDNFKYFLTFFFRLIYRGDNHDLQVLKFLDSFLDYKCSPEHCALVIGLLPAGNHKKEVQEFYNILLKKLLGKDHIVKICLYGKLKQNSIGYY